MSRSVVRQGCWLWAGGLERQRCRHQDEEEHQRNAECETCNGEWTNKHTRMLHAHSLAFSFHKAEQIFRDVPLVSTFPLLRL
jgi:hypothetical protein